MYQIKKKQVLLGLIATCHLLAAACGQAVPSEGEQDTAQTEVALADDNQTVDDQEDGNQIDENQVDELQTDESVAEKQERKALEAVAAQEGNSFSCEYDGITREFIEYAPVGDATGIVLMLHGYGSDAQAFRSEIKMDEYACEKGYAVVYLTGSVNAQGKTSSTGWNSGLGESDSDDIGFLLALANYLQEKYHLTRQETFAAGFSNGGFMMYRIATEGQDTFAGVASVAGMMPQMMWDQRAESAQISILQINGTKDDVVPMNLNGTAKYAKAPAIEDVLDYFVAADGLSQQTVETLSEKAELTKHFESEKSEQVWQVLIQDGRHSWPDEKLYGFSTNQLIIDFFDEVKTVTIKVK